MRKKIMIIGLGVLGSKVLDMLMQSKHNHEIIVAGKNKEKIHERTNLADLVASNLGYTNHISYVEMDLNNISETAETLYKINPDIIFNATTLMSYWVPSTLPKETFKKLYFAFTGWQVPVHLTLAFKLMKAVKESGRPIRVINASYPDVTNPALDKINLAPEVGIGNVANVFPVIKRAISTFEGLSIEDLDIRVYAHHHFSYMLPSTGSDKGLPYHIEIFYNGEEISSNLDLNSSYKLLNTRYKRTRGLEGMIMTAASAVNVINSMANNTQDIVHAPGPNGLPGGYPVKISKQGTEVILPQNKTIEEIVNINIQGQILDGVEKLDEEGNIYFTSREMNIVKEIFGYDCLVMNVKDCEMWANELKQKYQMYSNNITKLQYV